MNFTATVIDRTDWPLLVKQRDALAAINSPELTKLVIWLDSLIMAAQFDGLHKETTK